MHATRVPLALAVILAAWGAATMPLRADSPGLTEAEIEAHLVQYRAEMSRVRERERLRSQQEQARLEHERLHRERQAALQDLLAASEVETASQSSQAELGRFKLDCAATSTPVIALGMLPDRDEETAAPPGGADDLAQLATNPIANLWQIQLQNVFVGESFGADGPANQMLVQPVIPWKLGDTQQITRITVPLVWTPDFDGPIDSQTGLGDTSILNFSIFDVGNGGQLGIGPSLVIPTASSDFTGQGKWQAGPAALYINTASSKIQWGMLAYQNWSFASAGGDDDRPEVSALFLQPIFVWHFAKGWYLGYSDIPISINWNNDAEISVPIGVKLGAIGDLGGQKVNAFIEPFYTLGKPDSGNEWGIKFGISLLFPTG